MVALGTTTQPVIPAVRRTAILTLVINGVVAGEQIVYLTPGDALVPVEALRRAGLDARGPVEQIVKDTGATPAQIALAWLLARAQIILPIPGTSSVAHLEENVGAAQVRLSRDQVAELTGAAEEE